LIIFINKSLALVLILEFPVNRMLQVSMSLKEIFNCQDGVTIVSYLKVRVARA